MNSQSICAFSEYESTDEPSCWSAVQALIDTQRQLADVLVTLSDEQYVRKPVGVVPSSIGGHVRHCLDHIESVLAAAHSGRLNYDQRDRGTTIETDREAALATFKRQENGLNQLAWRSIEQPLVQTTLLSADAAAVTLRTTLGRELAFVLSHTVHHSALVAVMVKLLGSSVPERFGWAPATIQYQEQVACAPCR